MHYKIFINPTVEAKHRRGLLGNHYDCFLSWMQEHGYSRHSMRCYVQCVTRFGQYLHRRGFRSIYQIEGILGQKLLVTYQRYCRHHGYLQRDSGLKLYLRVLEESGVIGSLPSKYSLLLLETRQYITFLKDQRGLRESTIRKHIYWVEKFLRFIGCQEGTSSVPTFGIVDVDRFIEQEAARLQHTPHQSLTGALRSFLRFLYQSGKLPQDISCLIICPRRYKLESLPSVLDWSEVQKILDSVERSTKMGLRDYAILTLLSSYGLRAGEVVRIKLEDIDWRKETIHITPRKTGKDLWLPLISQVGKAILEYLKRGRPRSKYRDIFLRTSAPWTPLNGNTIAHVVNRHIQLAGLTLPRYGAHLIRHSFATYLNRMGLPLKQIGDMLGHQDHESTHIYTKTATEHLREVALEIPEVK